MIPVEIKFVSKLSALVAAGVQSSLGSNVIMAYQPKINLNTSELCGYEALLRWRDGSEIIGPELIVRAAECAGSYVVDSLFGQIIHRVLSDMEKVPEDFRMPVAVNLNPNQVCADTGRMIEREASARGINSKLIDIEVTEHMPIGDVSDFGRRLHEMRPYVGKIFIDDFGVGHSTLSSLQLLQVDGVKLDRVFMANASTEVGLSFVCSVVDMCHILGMTVVVEGVEVGKDHSFAICCGADIGQGFAYGLPSIGKFEILTVPEGCGRECGGRYIPGQCDRVHGSTPPELRPIE